VPGKNALIALQWPHVVKCPYCIDAYNKRWFAKGITRKMRSDNAVRLLKVEATLSPWSQMMNKYNKAIHFVINMAILSIPRLMVLSMGFKKVTARRPSFLYLH